MGIGTLALAVLKKYWPFLLGALIIGGTLTYIKVLKVERDYYKEQTVKAKAETKKIAQQFNKALEESIARETQLEIDNGQLTDRVLEEQRAAQEWFDKHNKAVKERIAANEELRKLKLSLDLIRLFNASKQPPGEHNEVVANTNPGNDGQATATQEVTGTELFTVIAENDANHLKCIATVEQWQKFWTGYVANVERARAQEP